MAMKRLQGKVAIVTASTQGIGFAIAERLGSEGASVAISSRQQKNVDEAANQLRDKGIDVLGVVCHVSNSDQRKTLIDKTVQKYGRIDVVVSNAAANPSTEPILGTTESVLDKLWEINVKAGILVLQDAAPYLKKGSSVILISSATGYQPQASMGMYGVTKTALLGLTKALAAEMAPDIRVNCIAPGFVPTRFSDSITGNPALKYGRIDVVVSNAAANPSTEPILRTTESVLDKLWEINVKAGILVLQDAAPYLKKGSSVILISSATGYQPQASMGMYGVTKTALLGLTKALAAEMAPDIRVNCIAPGFVPTHFSDSITGNPALRKELEEKTLMNRLGTTTDIAAAAAFLASDDASYITGETLIVAGGVPSRL